MDRDHNYPNLTQAIILILLFWGLSVLWGILVAILGKVFGFPFEKEPMVLGISKSYCIWYHSGNRISKNWGNCPRSVSAVANTTRAPVAHDDYDCRHEYPCL